jgi:hypothetical protein
VIGSLRQDCRLGGSVSCNQAESLRCRPGIEFFKTTPRDASFFALKSHRENSTLNSQATQPSCNDSPQGELIARSARVPFFDAASSGHYLRRRQLQLQRLTLQGESLCSRRSLEGCVVVVVRAVQVCLAGSNTPARYRCPACAPDRPATATASPPPALSEPGVPPRFLPRCTFLTKL